MRTLPLLALLPTLAVVAVLPSSTCGCAPAGETLTPLEAGTIGLPQGFEISAPWEEGRRHRITKAYGVRGHAGTNRPTRSNDLYALDFDMEQGEPVLSVADGRVRYAGPASGGWASYGNIVLVEHGQGISSLYAHLHNVGVGAGDRVAGGGQVGTAGDSGGSFGAHLHLALYKDVKLANGPGGTGPYGGASVLPEPFGETRRVGLTAGQCIEVEAGPEARYLPW